MGLWNFFSKRRNARKAALISSEVAQRSVGPVLGRVRRRAASMRISEARGYVRARSLEIVHRELSAVQKGREKLDPALQTEIVSQATEAVIVRVMAELRSSGEAPAEQKKRAA
ncbi:MAG: hypothetical protein DWQ37_10315 [Planctomycetota bacterium]|nr:MAG: hypothetical protein DWQ37_10315 [Planctomycetota bacterium]